MFVRAISCRLVGMVGVVGRNGGATSVFSTYTRSDDIAETVESLLQKVSCVRPLCCTLMGEERLRGFLMGKERLRGFLCVRHLVSCS